MRILLASSSIPFLTAGGGAQRTELLLKALEKIGAVECLFIAPAALAPAALEKLSARCNVKDVVTTEDILRTPASRKDGSIKTWAGQRPVGAFLNAGRYRWQPHAPGVERLNALGHYDLIVARYLQAACAFDLWGRQALVLDVDDYDPDRLRQRIEHAGFWKSLTLRRALRFSELAHRKYIPRAEAHWVCNPDDRRHSGLGEAIVLPNIPYLPAGAENAPAPAPPPTASQIFLMVGTMSYSANADGVEAFIRHAWPDIIKSYPQAEFHVVGQGMSADQKIGWGRVRGVKAIGFVADLREAYARCLATVAPMQAGGGTNIKVLEAGAYRRVCVVTRISHRGFESTLPDNEACLRVESVDKMTGACLRLLSEPGLAARLGVNAAHAVRQHYTAEVFNAAVRAGCERALAAKQEKPTAGFERTSNPIWPLSE